MAKDRVTMCNGRFYDRDLAVAWCFRAACGKIMMSRVEAFGETSLWLGVLVLTVPAALR